MDESVFSRGKPCFSKEEFEKIRKSCVAVAGVGALGCVVSEILIRSGVGKIIIVDNGVIDTPDLGRQSLYFMGDLGKNKVEVARKRLLSMTQASDVEAYFESVDNSCSKELFKHTDCVVDCLDNYKSRFELEGCLSDNQFLVHGGVEKSFGQITTLQKNKTQSLKKLYAGVDDTKIPIPVMTSAVFLIGSLMAQETINVLLKKPKLLGVMLIVELLSLSFEKIQLQKL